MSYKIKKLSWFFITIVAFIMILTGCKSNKEVNSDSSSYSGSNEETYNLTMAYYQLGAIDDLPNVQEEINKITKEKINATVTLLPINIGSWQQQTNLMVTGNEKLDLMMTGSDFGPQATKGQLIPLDELLQSHGQEILDTVPSHLFEATKVNGEIYGVPSFRDMAMQMGFVMRKDLVDKYNIDVSQIKTFEDLEPIFQTIFENESGLYPIGNTTTPVGEALMTEYFDILGDRLGALSMDGERPVENLFESQEYIDAIQLARKWFEAGFVLKDAATTEEVHTAVVKSGKALGYFVGMKPGIETQETLATGFEMVAIPLTNPIQTTSNINGVMLSVVKNSVNPEKAMEFMNLLYADSDIMNLLTLGIEGEHYVVKDDGTATLPEGLTDSGYQFQQWAIGNNFLTFPWEGNDPEVWTQMEEFNDSATLSPVFGFIFNPDTVKTEIAATTNVLEQYRKGLESGTLDPKKSLKDFNEKLKAAGLDKIIAEKQRQLDEWKANK